MVKIITTIFYSIFVALIIGIAGLLVATMLPIPGNIEMKIVKSGSMEPAIPTGSLVVVKPQALYALNDVITFGEDTKTQIPTTHRIVAIEGEGANVTFSTKGDANEENDSETVAAREVIGRVVAHVPYVGFILDFARQPVGFTLLIAIPAGLIILEELLTIIREARRGWRKRRGDDDSIEEQSGSSNSSIQMVYVKKRVMDEIYIPMMLEIESVGTKIANTRTALQKNIRVDSYGAASAIVAGLMCITFLGGNASQGTLAYFSDIETSLGNIFRAGIWNEVAALSVANPQDIVLNEFLPNPDGIAYSFDFGNDASNMPQGEWVELFNNDALPIDLTGWYLADESGGAGNTQAIISLANTQPATTTIPAGGWLVVYFNKPVLNDTGDSIFLYTPDGVLVDSYTYDNPSAFCTLEPTPTDPNSTTTPTGTPGNGPNADCAQAQVAPNKSYARIPDGTGAFVDPIPTPGGFNIPENAVLFPQPQARGADSGTQDEIREETAEESTEEAPEETAEETPPELPSVESQPEQTPSPLDETPTPSVEQPTEEAAPEPVTNGEPAPSPVASPETPAEA